MKRLIPMEELRHRVSMLTVIACEGAEHDFRKRGIVKKVINLCNRRFDRGTWKTHYTPTDASAFVLSHLSANLADLHFISMENDDYGSGEAYERRNEIPPHSPEEGDEGPPDRN